MDFPKVTSEELSCLRAKSQGGGALATEAVVRSLLEKGLLAQKLGGTTVTELGSRVLMANPRA